MKSYFDAHVYVSNFGSMNFMLRLPQTVLPETALRLYATGEGLEWWATDKHTILEWRLDSEPDGDWTEGEHWMSRLLPLRDELVRGDYRSLYLGWLSSLLDGSPEEDEEDDYLEDEEEEEDYEEEADDKDISEISGMEPPVPAGLGSLTGAQVALTEFLGIDSDLLAVAAEASPHAPANEDSGQKVELWVAQLPEQEVRAIIARLIHGEGSRMEAELQSRYYRSRNVSTMSSEARSGSTRRTASDLLAKAVQRAQERKQQEVAARERKRHAHLAGIVPRFSELWSTVNTLAEEQKSSSYDKIGALLVDMRDAYAQAGRRPEFDVEFARFLGKYSRRTALVRKLKEVRLTS